MILAGLLACDAERTLLEERSRPLGEVRIGAETWTFDADLRRWRSSAGWTEDGGVTGPFEVTYVSVRAATAKGRVRGDADHTWTFDDPTAAAAFLEGLAFTACAADDRAAFRLGDGPWRWLVAVGPGGAAGLLERDAESCVDALGAWPSAESWLREAASHPDVCAHLTHLRRRADAVRCHLRQSAAVAPAEARRDQLPNAVNDPSFDDDLLAVLTDGAPGSDTFAPYRVRSLLPELSTAQRAALAEALRARGPALRPWEVVTLAVVDPGAARALPLAPGTAPAALAAEVLMLPADHPWRTPPPPAPAPWAPPEVPPGPPCPPTSRAVPDRCP